MPVRFTIYCLTCVVSGKKYVGQTQLRAADRWSRHVYDALRSKGRIHCVALVHAIRKYGSQNFSHKIVGRASTQAAANKMEAIWISRMNCRAPHGYNLDSGGRGSEKSTETLRKIGERSRLRWASIPIEKRGDSARKWHASRTIEERKAQAQRYWANMKPEARELRNKRISIALSLKRDEISARVQKHAADRSPKERQVISRRMAIAMTPERRAKSSIILRAWWAAMTPAERAAFSLRRGGSTPKRRWAAQHRKEPTPKQKKQKALKCKAITEARWKNITDRSVLAKKAWVTRRANIQQSKESK